MQSPHVCTASISPWEFLSHGNRAIQYHNTCREQQHHYWILHKFRPLWLGHFYINMIISSVLVKYRITALQMAPYSLYRALVKCIALNCIPNGMQLSALLLVPALSIHCDLHTPQSRRLLSPYCSWAAEQSAGHTSNVSIIDSERSDEGRFMWKHYRYSTLWTMLLTVL